MQQMVGLLAERLAEELLVELDDVGVLVRLADSLAGVLAVDGVHTGLDHAAVPVMEGLAGTADTAAGAGHDLDCMEVVHAGADTVEQLAGIAEGMGYAYVHRQTVEIDRGVTYALESPELIEVYTVQLLAGVELVGSTHGGLDHTSGGSEDDRSTSGLA